MAKYFSAAAFVFLSLVLIPRATYAQEVLRAVAALPVSVDYTKSFLRFIDLVNNSGQDHVRIQFLGGPEVVPYTEQADAVRRGVVDMQHGPASHYSGLAPEGDALVGSTRNVMELRANGGLQMLNGIFEERINAHILGHFDSGFGFHIYLRETPGLEPDGSIDFSGLRLRSQPIYREFFARLGGIVVSAPAAETYTALSRGAVDGTGWPLIGITDLGWHEHLAARIDPPFFQADILVIINKDKWQSLSNEARTTLEALALEYEKTSYDYFQAELPKHDAALRAGGMEVIDLTGDARRQYLELAYRVPWDRLKERAPKHYDDLLDKFYAPPEGDE